MVAELGAFLCTDVVKITEKEMKIETVVNQKVIEHEAHHRINNGKTDVHAYN